MELPLEEAAGYELSVCCGSRTVSGDQGAKLPAPVSRCLFLGVQGGVGIYTSQECGLGLFTRSWMLGSHFVLSPFPPGP